VWTPHHSESEYDFYFHVPFIDREPRRMPGSEINPVDRMWTLADQSACTGSR